MLMSSYTPSDHSSDTLRFYTRTSDVWEAIFQDCYAAKDSISLEQYILFDDDCGRRFLEMFAYKAAQGVNVRLIVDGVGSRSLISSRAVENIRKAGGAVAFYNEITAAKLFWPSKWFPRDHCKTVIIDNRLGYVGSACFAQTMQDWRDVQVRVTEPEVVAVMQSYFDELWRRIAYDVKKDKKAKAPGRALKTTPVRYMVSGGQWHRRNRFYRELLTQIRAAKKCIYLVTPYFMPPYRLRKALRRAARNGIDVKIMISEKTDVRYADYLSRFYYPKMLRAGIKIYHFKRTILHAKYSLIDDNWASVGSSNIDYLSLLRNREGNIITHEKPDIDFIRTHFTDDLQECDEASLSDYREITLIHDILSWFKTRRKKDKA